MAKQFSINCINEIKCESVEEFETSIFSDVYHRAHDLVEYIIASNQKLAEKNELRDYCNEKQIVNMISFLGERGMGKSSAMLSFAFYLKKYRPNECKQTDPFFLKSEKEQQLNFSVLSKVDVAMMMQGESLFDVILAKMWDEYSELCEKTQPNSDFLYHETSTKFDEVKKAYVRYKTALKKGVKSFDIARLNELHELSNSLNLRKSFESLVCYYLKCMSRENSESYLVIPLDDLDMVIENVYEKLEEVRFLLTIPRVIVLLTADVNRMTLELNGHFSGKSLCSLNVTDMEKEQVRGYVANYLGKVLPRNMRVYMPLLQEIESQKLKLEDEGIIAKYYIHSKFLLEEGIDLDKVYLICLALNLNIMAHPKHNNFMIRTNTLRNVVNSMNELFSLIKEREDYDAVSRWLQKELNVGYNELYHDEYTRLLHLLRERADRYYNEVLCYLLKDGLSSFDSSVGYGSVIKSLLAMWGRWPLEEMGKNLVQWTYAMVVSKAVEKKDDSAERLFVKRDIFSSVIRSVSTITEGPMNINRVFVLRLEDKGNASSTMVSAKNVKMMMAIFNALMFYNMDEIFKHIQLKKRYESKGETSNYKFVVIQPKEEIYVSSFDNLFYNAVNIDIHWKAYIDEIYKVLQEDAITSQRRNNILTSMKGPGLNLDELKKWKAKYKIKNVWDILPVQNVSVIMEIAERLRQFYGRRSVNLFRSYDFSDELIRIVIDVFKEVEEYYDIQYMNTVSFSDAVKYRYSEKLERLQEMGVFKEANSNLDALLLENRMEEVPLDNL